MASHAADERSTRRLLTLGRVDRLRVQVGYRARPDGAAYLQFLLDLPVPEPESADRPGTLDESRVLDALEPVLSAGTDAPRHYSLHQHRWHTSWGASPGALDVALLVTTGTRTAGLLRAGRDAVVPAFRDLVAMVGRPDAPPTSRDLAVIRARRSAAAAYSLDVDTLSLASEEHHPASDSWTVWLRSTTEDDYEVVVGLVDGYVGSVQVRHEDHFEVSDSVGVD